MGREVMVEKQLRRAKKRDEVLLAFQEACKRPTVEQIVEWTNRYPDFAEDIRAHAAIARDWAASEKLDMPSDRDTLIDFACAADDQCEAGVYDPIEEEERAEFAIDILCGLLRKQCAEWESLARLLWERAKDQRIVTCAMELRGEASQLDRCAAQLRRLVSSFQLDDEDDPRAE